MKISMEASRGSAARELDSWPDYGPTTGLKSLEESWPFKRGCAACSIIFDVRTPGFVGTGTSAEKADSAKCPRTDEL
jgi:hypothetical protein